MATGSDRKRRASAPKFLDGRRHGRALLAATLLALLVLGTSCASGPRHASSSTQGLPGGARVALAGFYATTAQGMGRAEQQRALAMYEEAAAGWLRERQLVVVPPRELHAHLRERDALGSWQDALARRTALAHHFVHAPLSGAPAEAIAMSQLHERGDLPAPYVLFGEVVYHSQTTCTERADRYNDLALVAHTTKATAQGPSPCVVSHLHLKLVDARTGKVLGQHRQLRELHAERIDESLVWANVQMTVDQTLQGVLSAPLPRTPSRQDLRVRLESR